MNACLALMITLWPDYNVAMDQCKYQGTEQDWTSMTCTVVLIEPGYHGDIVSMVWQCAPNCECQLLGIAGTHVHGA